MAESGPDPGGTAEDDAPTPAATLFTTADTDDGVLATVQGRESRLTGFRAPAPGGVAFGHPLVLDFRSPVQTFTSKVRISLNSADITARFGKGPLDEQWLATIDYLPTGVHQLTVASADPKQPSGTMTFTYRIGRPLDRIVALAEATTRRLAPQSLKWDWGPGLLLYALARLDGHRGAQQFDGYQKAYFAHHFAKGLPKINWSDRCAPALSALELYKRTRDPAYRDVCDRVATYLKTARPTRAGGLNHMGTWGVSRVYPTSMWIDSLMMYNVFAARYARETGDGTLREFAATQPQHFARVLQDPETKLWRHAYLTNLRRNLPIGDTYWLRGNGWAMASLPETIAMLPATHPARPVLSGVFLDTARAMLPYQGELGLWTTVINRPDRIYLETSGSALAAYGLMRGAHDGVLPASFGTAGEKAYLGIMDRLQEKAEGVSMPEISHNTMPYSFLGYSLVPQRNDLTFGLAALILAGIEYDKGVSTP